jgi:hypothetical protein
MANPLIRQILFLAGIALLLTLYTCTKNEPMAPEEKPQPIETTILGGPADNDVLPNNSTATFNWDGTISPGYITAFTYSFSEVVNESTLVKLYSDSALARSYSKSNLETGSYHFEVMAHGEHGDSTYSDETPAIRDFSIVADSIAPNITILSGSKEGSYAVTGSSVFFEWSASDPSPGGEIVSYSYTLADSSVAESALDWSTPRLETTQIGYYNLSDAVYRFWIRATDISGLSTTISHHFTIKPADILFAIDRNSTPEDIDFWHQHVLHDFAYEDYYLSSDPSDFLSKIDASIYSTIVWAANNGTSILPGSEFASVYASGSLAEALDNYLNAGGHLWISGSEVLYDLGGNTWPPAIYGDSSFVKEVLHIQYSDESDWNFQGGLSTGVVGYKNVIVDGNATLIWCDRVDPVDGEAETILTFISPDSAFEGQSAAIRYPAGVSKPGETKIIFFGFYLVDSEAGFDESTGKNLTSALKISDIYDMATTIFTDFGENND